MWKVIGFKRHIRHNNPRMNDKCGEWLDLSITFSISVQGCMADVDASGSPPFFCFVWWRLAMVILLFHMKKFCYKISPLYLSVYWSILWVAWCTVFMHKRLGETFCKHGSPFPAWVLNNLVRHERHSHKVFRVSRRLSLLFVERVCHV